MHENAASPEWDERRFYVRSLFLPLLIPLLVTPILYFLDSVFGVEEASSWFIPIYGFAAFFGGIGMVSILIGGIPYILLVAIGSFALRSKSLRHYKLWLISLPLQMAAIFVLGFLLLPNEGNQFIALICAGFCLLLGYIYIGTAFGLGWWIKRKHLKRSLKSSD